MNTPQSLSSRQLKRQVTALLLLFPLTYFVGSSLSPQSHVASQSIAPETTTSLSQLEQAPSQTTDSVAVLGFNDLGMHCMNEDFSEICILPPYNTLRVQVVDRTREEPRIINSGVTVRYSIPGNTHSADKTNFWLFAEKLFGLKLQPNIGLTGNGLSGTMTATANRDWTVTGVPVTQTSDNGRNDPYQLAQVSVIRNGQTVGQTRFVVPVSWEISCNLCHNGDSVADDILRSHDRRHNTNLVNAKPVLCASCHADPALGAPGKPGLPTMSGAMHTAHATRLQGLNLENSCYACHPGFRSQCQRDIHASKGISCTSCHGDMLAVGSPQRKPWVDEPRCDNCHSKRGFEFEQPGKLYRDSLGHMGIGCGACHGSPHAITPTLTQGDNLQALAWQGHTGKINTCTVCHSKTPNESFPHRRSDD
jgi:hypothetical protein